MSGTRPEARLLVARTSPTSSSSSRPACAWVADHFTATGVGGTAVYDLTEGAR
jgi:hypothetical protein